MSTVVYLPLGAYNIMKTSPPDLTLDGDVLLEHLANTYCHDSLPQCGRVSCSACVLNGASNIVLHGEVTIVIK